MCSILLVTAPVWRSNVLPLPRKAMEKMNPGGSILICDFFKIPSEGKSPMSGGHKASNFYDAVEKRPLKIIKDIDITKYTAPNMTIIDELLTQFGKPTWEMIFDYLGSNFRTVMKFIEWKYEKKLDKIDRKYFSGERNAESFAKFKSYRLLLLTKQ